MAHGLDATISYDRHPKAPGILGHLVDGSALGSATGHHCEKWDAQDRGESVLPSLVAIITHGQRMVRDSVSGAKGGTQQ